MYINDPSKFMHVMVTRQQQFNQNKEPKINDKVTNAAVFNRDITSYMTTTKKILFSKLPPPLPLPLRLWLWQRQSTAFTKAVVVVGAFFVVVIKIVWLFGVFSEK